MAQQGLQMIRRVVIADDQDDMRMLMRLVFVGDGWTVTAEATDGLEAMVAWEDQRELGVHLIVLDQQMPGLTGIQVAERILADNPDQQIVIVTAYLSDEVVARAEAAGVVACINKADLVHLPTSGLLRA